MPGPDGPAYVVKMATCALAFLGVPLPWEPAWCRAGELLGAVLLIPAAWAVLSRGVLRPPETRLRRIAIGLILCAFGTDAVAMLGRVDQTGLVIVPPRYMPLVMLLHLGLLTLALPRLARWAGGRLARARAVLGAGTVCAVALLGLQAAFGSAQLRQIDRQGALVRQFFAGTLAPEMREFVYPDPALAVKSRDVLRSYGLPR